MKRFLFVLAFLVMAPCAFAQNTSTTQMSLASSQAFVTRLQYLMGQQARTVATEALAGTCGSERKLYAAKLLNSTGGARQLSADAAPIVVGGINLIGTVVGNANPNLVDSSATDASILSQIATFWNALSGCTVAGS